MVVGVTSSCAAGGAGLDAALAGQLKLHGSALVLLTLAPAPLLIESALAARALGALVEVAAEPADGGAEAVKRRLKSLLRILRVKPRKSMKIQKKVAF